MRSWFVSTLLCTLLAVVLCFVPLFNLLGYEFSFALALVAGPAAIGWGMAVGKERPDGAFALIPAFLGATLMLLPALVVMTLNALRVKNCDYLDGLEFFAILPWASACYGTALGVTLAQLGRGWQRKSRLLWALALALAPLVWALVSLYRQPPIVLFDHLWGYFAGSLYDEVVRVDERLTMFRTATLLRVSFLGLFLWTWGRKKRGGLAPVLVVALIGLGVTTWVENAWGPKYGFRVTRADIEKALPVRIERPGLVIHLPRHVNAQTQKAIADDHAFRLHGLTQTLDLTLEHTIHSYVYANTSDKARLMGGRNTMVAKPWLHEIHVHDAQAPHDVVPHELAHAVAAQFGSPLLNVSARYILLVNMGLVEGFAEALTPPRGELSLDAWSRALRTLKMAPDMRQILGPTGFWSEAPRRAYTIAGSFVSYLLRTYGATPLKQAYPGGDFELAYGKPLDALVSEWEAYLETVPLSDAELHLAEEQFKTPSIFVRPCAHEIAELQDQARHTHANQAVAIYEQICKHLDNNLASRLELTQAKRRAGQHDAFLQEAAVLRQDPGLTAAQRQQLIEAQGEIYWQRGDTEQARAAFQSILEAQPRTDVARLQWVRVWALEQEATLRDTLHAFLSNRLVPMAAVLRLSQAHTQQPADKTLPYLVARQLVTAQSCKDAVSWLERAAQHPFAPIEAERVRLLAECQHTLGEQEAALRTQSLYVEQAPTSGERQRALDTLARWRWQEP